MAKEIRDTYNVPTKVVIQDFGKLNTETNIKAMHALIEDTLKDRDVSVLVNNVGFGSNG